MEKGWVWGPQKATELHAVRFLLSGVGGIESVFPHAIPGWRRHVQYYFSCVWNQGFCFCIPYIRCISKRVCSATIVLCYGKRVRKHWHPKRDQPKPRQQRVRIHYDKFDLKTSTAIKPNLDAGGKNTAQGPGLKGPVPNQASLRASVVQRQVFDRKSG